MKIFKILAPIFLVIISIVFAFCVFEFYFRYIYDQSDSSSFTFTGQKWKRKYWKPINSWGFRDIEHEKSKFLGKKVLFVVGDSFVAGAGIKDTKDRFVNILREKLKNQYVVISFARNGWDTRRELKHLKDFELSPDSIVLSYYVNDIKSAASESGFEFRRRAEGPKSEILKYLNGHSFLVEHLYYKTAILKLFRRTNNWYSQDLKAAYDDEKIWIIHQKEIHDFVKYCKENAIDLSVVIFPPLTEVEQFSDISKKVENVFKDNKVNVINLSERLKNRKTKDLIVNKYDAHPSKKLHREIANILLKSFGD